MNYCKYILLVFFVILPSLSVHNALAETNVYHQKKTLPNDKYMMGLLELALSYSDERHVFIEQSEDVTRARIEQLVEAGELTVMWTGASQKLDAKFVPVRIPAYKGLMGHRVFIIRRGDQARFDAVTSLEDLKRIKMGQGKTWTDTSILKAAGMNVVTTLKAPGLYHMLEGGRFDAFPRGVHEPWQEIASRPELDLTVEKNIVLKYTMPYYFYVSPNHSKIAVRILEGLEMAIADGSFDTYFFNDPEVKNAIQKSNLADRRLFSIANPAIPPLTPLERKELWLDMEKIKLMLP